MRKSFSHSVSHAVIFIALLFSVNFNLSIYSFYSTTTGPAFFLFSPFVYLSNIHIHIFRHVLSFLNGAQKPTDKTQKKLEKIQKRNRNRNRCKVLNHLHLWFEKNDHHYFVINMFGVFIPSSFSFFSLVCGISPSIQHERMVHHQQSAPWQLNAIDCSSDMFVGWNQQRKKRCNKARQSIKNSVFQLIACLFDKLYLSMGRKRRVKERRQPREKWMF